MGVSRLKHVTVPVGEMITVVEEACVLTSVVVADTGRNSWGGACILVPHGGWEALMWIITQVGQTKVWTGRVACAAGIDVSSQAGDLTVTIGYE